jgi:hypothetical protein
MADLYQVQVNFNAQTQCLSTCWQILAIFMVAQGVVTEYHEILLSLRRPFISY